MSGVQTEQLLGPLNSTEQKYAPAALFASGDVSLLRRVPRVSVIGSRAASAAGLRGAEFLTRLLVERQVVVVSGLAKGIDTVAHQTAVDLHGSTIAVLGTPLTECSPRENRALQERLAREQLVISQFSPEVRTTPKNFVLRNRIMALISHASVIVEAGEKSGTQHQAWEMLRLGRTVFLPKPLVDDSLFEWPREMVRYGAIPFTRDSVSGLLDEYLPRSEAELCEVPF